VDAESFKGFSDAQLEELIESAEDNGDYAVFAGDYEQAFGDAKLIVEIEDELRRRRDEAR
jgi:hypothetical protein